MRGRRRGIPVIRKAQVEALRWSVRRRFAEDELTRHVRRTWPDELAAAGEESIRGLVRRTLDTARSHGIDRLEDLARFLNLVMRWGEGFDRDPDRPWAREILASGLSGTTKVYRLTVKARDEELSSA